MQSLFAELKSLGIYDEATIIVHGDHGSRIGERPYISAMPESLTEQDMIDHYATLLAIKAPGIAPGLRETPQALQRVFADTFLGGARPTSPKPGEVFLRRDDADHFNTLKLTFPDAPVPVALAPVQQSSDKTAEEATVSELRR